MIPLIIDISDLRVLVFGFGTVGKRKADYFKDEAKEIRILEKEDVPAEDTELASLIESYDIIITATNDPAFNRKVCEIAKDRKKWYNSATDAGSFLIPAAFRKGDVSFAVSTSGKSPAVSSFIKEELQKSASIHPLQRMMELQVKLRGILAEKEPSQEERATILKKVLRDSSVWKDLTDGKEVDSKELLTRYK